MSGTEGLEILRCAQNDRRVRQTILKYVGGK
jgi:hypothetical protein